jgi:hypothetical protein
MAGLKYPLVELFTELDRLHFGGRLTAAGWQVKAYFFNYRDQYDSALLGRCDPSAHFILIYPERKAPKEEALRQTMLHEMAHASNFEQYRHWGHGSPWRAEIRRLLSSEPCLRGELSHGRKCAACAKKVKKIQGEQEEVMREAAANDDGSGWDEVWATLDKGERG